MTVGASMVLAVRMAAYLGFLALGRGSASSFSKSLRIRLTLLATSAGILAPALV